MEYTVKTRTRDKSCCPIVNMLTTIIRANKMSYGSSSATNLELLHIQPDHQSKNKANCCYNYYAAFNAPCVVD